jgi:hypothetical protein
MQRKKRSIRLEETVTAKTNDSGIDRIDQALNALMMRRNRSATIGGVSAIKLR